MKDYILTNTIRPTEKDARIVISCRYHYGT